MGNVTVVGSYVQDLAFRTACFPSLGETRIGEFFTGPGGKGFNQAVACHRQGIPTTFIGAVGTDVFADVAREFAEQDGLQLSLQTIADVASGAASIVVNDESENLIVVALGANERLSAEFIRENTHTIKTSAVVLCQAECGLGATAEALRLGRASGAITVFNPAPIHTDVSLELLSDVDVLVPNETEFSFLLTHLVDEPKCDVLQCSDEELGALCAKLPVPLLVVTLGARGAFFCVNSLSAGSAIDLGGRVSGEYQAIAPIAVTPIDTTGAGDAFNGGLAAGLVRYGGSIEPALKYASAVGGLSTTRAGTAPAMPREAEVKQYIETVVTPHEGREYARR